MTIACKDRSKTLQQFIDLLQRGFEEATMNDLDRRALVDGFFERFKKPGVACRPEASRLLACQHFKPAITHVLSESMDGNPVTGNSNKASFSTCAALASVLAELEPLLAWYRRIGSEVYGEPFYSSHANTCLIGPGGLEECRDATIGISLVAPHIRYPDHNHPPEELYFVLSPGQWWNTDLPWFTPNVGGIVHNPPGIMHAMRTDKEPILAIWCLL